MRKSILNNKGSAIVYVLVAIVILTVLGVTLLNTGLFENKVSIVEKNNMEAYFIAKSGALATAKHLMKPSNHAYVQSLIDAGTIESSETTLGSGSFKVKVSEYNISNQVPRLRIEATGTVIYQSNPITKTESVLIDKITLFTKAVFATGNVVNATNSLIDGEVEAGGFITNAGLPYIANQPPIQYSPRRYPDPVMPNTDAFEVAYGQDEVEYPGTFNVSTNPHMPTHTNLNVTNDLTILDNSEYANINNRYGNYRYEYMSISSSTRLTFDISKDMRIYLKDFDANNAEIEVKSSSATQGKLFIYVENSFTFKGDIISAPETFFLIAANNSNISMQTGTQVFNGYIYGPKSNMEYKSGTYSGAIICDNLSLSSGGEVRYDGTGITHMIPEDIGLQSFGYTMGLWGK